jgi:hypothetical protein
MLVRNAAAQEYPKWVSHPGCDGVVCGLRYCSDTCRAVLGHVYRVEYKTASQDEETANRLFIAGEKAEHQRQRQARRDYDPDRDPMRKDQGRGKARRDESSATNASKSDESDAASDDEEKEPSDGCSTDEDVGDAACICAKQSGENENEKNAAAQEAKLDAHPDDGKAHCVACFGKDRGGDVGSNCSESGESSDSDNGQDEDEDEGEGDTDGSHSAANDAHGKSKGGGEDSNGEDNDP